MRDKVMFWSFYLTDRALMAASKVIVGTFVAFLYLDTLSPGMPLYFWNWIQQCQCPARMLWCFRW